MLDFTNQVVVVTGSGSPKGIGRTIAKTFANQGAKLVIVDINEAGVNETVDIIKESGHEALGIKVDITSKESVDAMVKTIMDKFGRIDVLVNNAGISQKVTVEDMTLDDMKRIFSVNMFGLFLCTQAVMKVMKQQNYGRIISLSSVSGKRGGGKYYEKLLADKGITYLGSFHNGFRQISNNKHEVRTPEDVKGLKIRVPGGEVYMDFFNTLGADPIAMSWSEVFTAVQQGTIDGQENGVSITKSAKMNEVQKYITIWNYSYENDLFVANSKIWNTLEPKTQQLLREKAKEACNWGRQQVENEEDGIIAEFEEDAIIVTKLTPEELNTFKNAVEPVREKFINKYGKENYNAFINK